MLMSLLATAVALSLSADQTASTPAAAAPDGYAACSIIYPAKRRLIHTDPLPAAQPDLATMTAAFGANLRGRLYSAEPTLEQIGDCHWEPTQAAATKYMDRIVRNITAQGFTTFWMRYTPTASN